jgi:aspartyl-tRNA(Asn)/glutamyl-tRNA(Gln) amidotransferase subunit C
MQDDSMKVGQDTVRKVAGLARLELSPEEEKRFARDLSDVLKAFRNLQGINTRGVRPSFQPLEAGESLREDKVEPSIPRSRLLRDLKNKEDGYIKGPRVV